MDIRPPFLSIVQQYDSEYKNQGNLIILMRGVLDNEIILIFTNPLTIIDARKRRFIGKWVYICVNFISIIEHTRLIIDIDSMVFKQCLPLLLLLVSTHAFKLVPLRSEGIRAIRELKGAQIGPGRGYSSDRQQISSIVCFNVNASPYSKTESTVHFDQGASFSEIEKSLRVDVSAKVGISIFSLEADVSYLKEIKDSEMAMSINYFQFVQSEMTMETGYGPAGALTMDGMRAYGPVDNPNPRFGLICGDKFISSFKVGANLVFSMKLQFQSSSEKEHFALKLGVNIGSFLSISTDIQSIATATNIMGRVEIMAYQSGGNPAELAKILNSTCGSSYCAATCSMLKMDDCMGAVNGLLKYASSNFPNQVNLNDPKALSPFSIGFADLQDIKLFGLNIPTAYVTKEVIAMREQIANALFRHQYYVDKINDMSIALPFDKGSKFWESLANLSELCKQNIGLIMDQTAGGILCFRDPQNCLTYGYNLLSSLKPIGQAVTIANESLKYKIANDVCSADFYPVSDTQWFSPQFDNSQCVYFMVTYFRVVNNTLSYSFSANQQGIVYNYTTVNLTADSDVGPFTGGRMVKWRSNSSFNFVSVPREISELTFNPDSS